MCSTTMKIFALIALLNFTIRLRFSIIFYHLETCTDLYAFTGSCTIIISNDYSRLNKNRYLDYKIITLSIASILKMSIKYKTKDFYKCDNQLIFVTVTKKLLSL